MAEGSKVGIYEAMPTTRTGDEARWSPPQTAMFATLASAGLWALIFAAGRWLVG
jgi:hypothetical protein